jgi:hypothetical protein
MMLLIKNGLAITIYRQRTQDATSLICNRTFGFSLTDRCSSRVIMKCTIGMLYGHTRLRNHMALLVCTVFRNKTFILRDINTEKVQHNLGNPAVS